MTHIKVVDPQTASGDAADFYKEAGVSLIMQCFSPRPDFGNLVNQMGNIMHFRKGTLSRRDHEAIATYVSALNHCPFWLDSHGAYLRLQGEPEEVVKAIAKSDLEAAAAAGLEPKRRAMLEFVRKITFDAHHITAEDTEALRQYGYDDGQLAEIVYIAALFAFFNRVADAFGIEGRGLLEMPMDEMRKILTR